MRATSADHDAITAVLDDFHAAAVASDEERYFAYFTPDGVFLGTDATERWDVAAFRAYAHPRFAQGRGWVMRATRRDVVVHGDVAWFDEDLETRNLGPARGSGVLERDARGAWHIAQYNLALTVPNDRFADVRALLDANATAPSSPAPVTSAAGTCARAQRCCEAYLASLGSAAGDGASCAAFDGASGELGCQAAIEGYREALTVSHAVIPAACQ
jgi:ketosteroid isomerase-like protein